MGRLSISITLAQIVAISPYPTLFTVAVVYFLYREQNRKRNARRIQVLDEGVIVLRNADRTDMPVVTETMNALRKRTLAKTIVVQRDAEQSMAKFLEKTARPSENTHAALAIIQAHENTQAALAL